MNTPANSMTGIRACIFDAYGTLFDVGSVAQGAGDALGDRWQALSELWRTKQLQYTWLRGLAGHHADFWQVTAEALDFALDALGLTNATLHKRLMALYLRISAYPEVAATLERLQAAGIRCAILSNGTPDMLAAAIRNAGLQNRFEAVLSVESVGVFKPHPSVYRLATDHLDLAAQEICFLSSNGWDAFSARAYGFHVLWCNRFGQPAERIPAVPDGEIDSLVQLPTWLGIENSGSL